MQLFIGERLIRIVVSLLIVSQCKGKCGLLAVVPILRPWECRPKNREVNEKAIQQ